MYKATREFIKARQPHSNFQLIVVNSVTEIGGGEVNNCFDNAYAASQASKETKNKVACMSGWLVLPFDKVKNCTAIIQHWWNVDSNGKHFDTTPLLDSGREYVQDFALYEYSRVNFEKIKSNVAMSLLYQNDKFSTLIDADSMLFVEIGALKTELLFKYE